MLTSSPSGRRSALIAATAFAIALPAITGCGAIAHSAPTTSAATPADQAIPAGPGPTQYTVQPQPAAGTCSYRYTAAGQPLPDPHCTPGATNPKVTQSNLNVTICRAGYSKSIRPRVSITNAEKRANAKAYSFTGSFGAAELDHLVSIELGGDPNDSKNLWVEPPSPGHRPTDGVNNPKDLVENKLHDAVCTNRVSLSAAQQAIATDWTTALPKLGLA